MKISRFRGNRTERVAKAMLSFNLSIGAHRSTAPWPADLTWVEMVEGTWLRLTHRRRASYLEAALEVIEQIPERARTEAES